MLLRHLSPWLMIGLLSAPAFADLTAAEQSQMQAAQIVILGEVHDNAAHHAGQAALLAQVAPKAVVFEMLSPTQADQVNANTSDDIAALGDAIGWEAAGWPDFALYQPIFEALGDAVVVGASSPREEIRRAFADGAASVFGTGAARFGLTDPLDPEEEETRRAMQFAAHCEAMPQDMMGGMVEAQRLRDARFSAATLAALEAHGAPVVVITGNGHARRDWGMPALIAQAAPDATVYSVGFIEAPAADDDPRFDATLVTAPADRGDPCAAFNK